MSSSCSRHQKDTLVPLIRSKLGINHAAEEKTMASLMLSTNTLDSRRRCYSPELADWGFQQCCCTVLKDALHGHIELVIVRHTAEVQRETFQCLQPA